MLLLDCFNGQHLSVITVTSELVWIRRHFFREPGKAAVLAWLWQTTGNTACKASPLSFHVLLTSALLSTKPGKPQGHQHLSQSPGQLFYPALSGYGFFPPNSSCPVSVQRRTGNGTGCYEPALTEYFHVWGLLKPLTCDSTQVPWEKRQPAASALRRPGPGARMTTKMGNEHRQKGSYEEVVVYQKLSGVTVFSAGKQHP